MTHRLNMYAVIWNEWVKDIVIAHDEDEARRIASDDVYEVDASNQPVMLIDDTLQMATNRGVMTVRKGVLNFQSETPEVKTHENKRS